MKRKLGNNIILLAGILGIAIYAVFSLMLKRAGSLFLIPALIVSLIVLARIYKVIRKMRCEFMNSPARYCRGKGIEIGSCGKHMVKGSMLVDIVDNFSSPTPYRVDYVADAHHLPEIDSNLLDYVSASHVLEHLTNPIKAVLEWMRILRPGGILWLKIPDKRKTFDVNREKTSLTHLIEDFRSDVPVDDPTHIEDQNKNSLPPRNVGHPYVHNHVWVPADIIELFNYLKQEYVNLEIVRCVENSCRNAQDFWIVVKKMI